MTRDRVAEILAVIDAGLQSTGINYDLDRNGMCWRCLARKAPTKLDLCDVCREELIEEIECEL